MSYVVRSRYGNFRLVLARRDGARPSRDDELTRRLWQAFDQRLAWRDPEALAAALALREELHPQASRFGKYSLETLRQQIESALWFGHIRFTEIVPVAAPRDQPSGLAAKAPRAAPPSAPVEPTWFELTLVDEVGQGIDGQEIGFSVSGKQHQLPTNGTGTAHLDDVQAASSFANARLPDVLALKEALKPRWDKIRTERILTEDDATLVFLRGQSLDTVSLESETPKLVSIQPYVEQARLLGMFFDTNKNFLLPGAIPSLRNIKRLYDRNPKSTLLVVGHTDTSGEPTYNDPLSLERAESVAQYLTDDVDAWLKRYGQGVAEKKRWGQAEDLLMIEALGLQGPQLETPIDRVGQSPVAWYQKWHNKLQGKQRAENWEVLAEDAKIGPKTRAQLIADYMNFDETTLPEGIKLMTHGCGENFPLERVEALDPEVSDAMDRRVELFFFDADLGIQPPAPGKHSKPGSLEYPEWCRRARRVHDFLSHANGPLCVSIHAPEDQETRLIVASESGQPIRVLSLDEAERDDETATFSFIPEFLPSSVQFQVERDGEIETGSPTVSPVGVRDSLFTGEHDSAADQVCGRPAASAVGEPESVSLPVVDAAPRRAKKAPKGSKVTVAIRWDNPNHRFLKRMDVWLQDLDKPGADGDIKPKKAPGNYRFELNGDIRKFAVQLRIGEFGQPSVLNVTQKFRLSRLESGSAHLHLERGGTWKKGARNPRFEKIAYTAKNSDQSVVAVKVDLLFLDITRYLKKHKLNPTFKDLLEHSPELKSKVKILEYTGGDPSVWPVIIPKGFPRARTQVGALIFFRNELLDSFYHGAFYERRIHENPDEVNYEHAIGSYFARPLHRGQYFDAEGTRRYLSYPSFGWYKQLVDSGKKPIVFLPLPKAHDFGILNTPTNEHPRLFHSALIALQAERHICRIRGVPKLKHLAMGGWSSGTDTLFEWAAVNEKNAAAELVDELYMLDGKSGPKKDLVAWFKHARSGQGRRKLRVIGTAYTEKYALQLKGQLPEDDYFFVYPGDGRYWYDDPDYKKALTTNSEPIRQFRANPSEPQLSADASMPTNVYLKRETIKLNSDDTVSQSLTLYSPGLGERRISWLSKEEAALLLSEEAPRWTGVLLPVATAADFVRITNWLIRDDHRQYEKETNFRHRHPWSAFGGIHREGKFVGYFQLCLEESDF